MHPIRFAERNAKARHTPEGTHRHLISSPNNVMSKSFVRQQAAEVKSEAGQSPPKQAWQSQHTRWLRALTSPTTEAQGSFQPLPIAPLGHQSPSDVHGRASKLSQVGIWPELVAPMIKAGMDSSCSSSEAPCEDAPDALIGEFAFAPTPAQGLLAKCKHPP